MDHKPVTSSNIESIGYHAPSRTLEVKFKSGGHYSYADVPKDVYDALMTESDGVGGRFHASVKGKFGHTKLG